jgi:hypothetical protein
MKALTLAKLTRMVELVPESKSESEAGEETSGVWYA